MSSVEASQKAMTNVFLTRALEKILQDKECRKSQHVPLRKACEGALKSIQEELKKSSNSSREAGSTALPHPETFISADKYFSPFELACKCGIPRIVTTALDCIQKLVAYGQLTGNSVDPEDPEKKLIDRMIETVGGCFVGEKTDEGVQLQIIKALLTIMTAGSVEVHGASVLSAVRCCYNIYLASKNVVNQTTAKASLTQILTTIFQKMESEGVLQAAAKQKMASLHPAVHDEGVDGGLRASSSADNEKATHQADGQSMSESQMEAFSIPSSASLSDMQIDMQTDVHVRPKTHAEVSVPSHIGASHAEVSVPAHHGAPTLEVAAHLETSVVPHVRFQMHGETCSEEAVETDVGAQVLDGEEEQSLEAMASMLVRNVLEKVLQEEGARQDGRKTPEPMGSLSQDENHSDASSLLMQTPLPGGSGVGKGAQFTHILQKDAFLVFRSLCKLSMKGVPDVSEQRSHEFRSKMLALELLLSILQNAGPVFKTDEVFISAIKQYLCVALSRNGVSSVPQVFEVSLSIFLTLLSSFKSHLKMQIEVFFKDIFLNILETPSSSYDHKWIVLQSLNRVCSDAQNVVDIYVNYDCDLSLSNIFERLVNDLSKISQGRQVMELGSSTLQEKMLRAKGLECLVSILKCMVEWSRDFYTDPSTTGLTAVRVIVPEGTDSVSRISADDTIRKSTGSLPSVQKPTVGTADVGLAESIEVTATVNSPEQFELLKTRKEIMQKGIKLFASKPKKGIKFLQDNDLIGRTPTDVARFFHTDERLDVTAIGDYLGETDDYCKAVMYAYVDQFEFGGMEFVSALRLLLSKFRLPGESQKIDRIMEKFAGRYCGNNSKLELFASADTAYVLAYSIIMLTTDLHNPQVKKKMSKEEYIRMNRGINDSKDLPPEYLEGIYNEISSNEIKMSRTVAVAKPVTGSEKQRRQAYNDVMEQLATTIMEEISTKDKGSYFTSATHVEHARGMFKVTWTPFLAAFSMALRDSEDSDIVCLCLDGFRCAIRISCIFGLHLERNAYISTLAKFTMVTSLTEMRPKNIETIKTLCAVAYTDGNYLQTSWVDVLRCISQLELAQLIGAGVKTRYLTTAPPTPQKAPHSRVAIDAVLGGTDHKKIQEQVGETGSQSIVVAVDRIFTGSTRLDRDAIVDFVRALCVASNEELSSPTHPRMFSLQKIIEISYYNMDRVRLEWSRMWEVIGGHFNTVGCLPNEEVSFFVVDSLRQLSMKFLEKREHANFRFQKDFLRPFEHIMKKNEALAIRDMVVRCVAQMVNVKVSNIMSGWKNIFSVFQMAAAEEDSAVVELGFQTTDDLFKNHFSSTIDSFQDAVKCLSEFACNALYPDTSMEAIRIICNCATNLATTPQMFNAPDEAKDPDKVWVRGWFPILFELSTVINRCKLDVRTRALTVMFDILKTHGHLYQQHWWQDMFNIVFRIFDNPNLTELQIEKSEWLLTTCNHALYAMMGVFVQFFNVLSPVVMGDILSRLVWCVEQDNEQLARSGTNCLEDLCLRCGGQFFPETWDSICHCAQGIFKSSLPLQLMTWQPEETDLHRAPSSLSVGSTLSSLTSETPSQMTENFEGHQPTDQVEASAGGHLIPLDRIPAIVAMPLSELAESGQSLAPMLHVEPGVVVGTGPSAPVDSEFGDFHTAAGQPGTSQHSNTGDGKPTVGDGEAQQLPTQQLPVGSGGTQQLPAESGTQQLQVQVPVGGVKEPSTEPAAGIEQQSGSGPPKPEEPPKKKKESSKSRKAVEEKGKKSKMKAFRNQLKEKAKGKAKDDVVDDAKLVPGINDDMKSRKSISSASDQSLFQSLIIKCVVQLELIQAIDSVLFFPNTSKRDDKTILDYAQSTSVDMPCPAMLSLDKGMYRYLSTSQLFVLLECLEGSHLFARNFNANGEQRTLLLKAGFRGRTRPNLITQETSSGMCALRMLYHMLMDVNREQDYAEIEERLLHMITNMLEYYLQLNVEVHRDAWTPLLLLILTRMLQLNDSQFKHHTSVHYKLLCELFTLELKLEVRSLLKRVFLQIGQRFRIIADILSRS